ncbi:MAG: hypothetical protein GY778_12600, partial [bacterium]|nr:hypothetical protein [bacterium]
GPLLAVEPALEIWQPGSLKAMGRFEMQDFFAKHSDHCKFNWDLRSDRPELISGVGIAMFPGKGNDLGFKKAGVKLGQDMRLKDVGPLLRSFIDEQASLLRISNDQLRLDGQRSLAYGEDKYLWMVEFQQMHQGVPVEGAHVFFRINHGNLVQFGARLIADVHLDTRPSLSEDEAWALASSAIGLAPGDIKVMNRGGELKIFPAMGADEERGVPYKGLAGGGYQHRLGWELNYLGAGDHHYRVIVDAHRGEILQFLDETRFATVQGDIYPVTNTDPLVTVGFPSCSVTNSGTQITDANGNYTYSGGTATSTLSGRYFNMNDNCGSISLSDNTTGDLDFSGSTGTDCATPGVGGAGNTHSSRSGFFHLTNINRKAASFFPGNGWLDSTVTANMNINLTCNAFWNGSTVNFYRSGGGCANTGELAAVFLHEWGHGMDTNSVGAASDRA